MEHDYLAGLADHLKPYVAGNGSRIHAPHVEIDNWHGEADRIGIDRLELANRLDASERAFAKLAWIMRDHEDFVARHTTRFRFKALLECFERCGAVPFDPDARLFCVSPFEPDTRLTSDLGPACRLTWVNETGRFGLRGDIEAEERRIWAWMLRTLMENGQSMMTPADIEALSQMPDPLQLFRGFGAPANASPDILKVMAHGPSWSDDRAVAGFYAARSAPLVHGGAARFIASATVPRSAVVAHFPEVWEFVVADPAALVDLNIERLPTRPVSDDLAA